VEGYFRYVDDILLVYNQTNIEVILHLFNSLTPGLAFTLEREQDGKLKFLDLTITKGASELTFEIFRKPTTTDTIIPNDSCHPLEQKLAATRYFANRIHTYNLDHPQKQKEIDIVKHIIHNNKYNTSLLNRICNNTKQKQRQRHEQENQNQRWVKFTYIGRETRHITKLFKNTSLKVAYTTKNNLGKLLEMQKTQKPNKFNKNGVYQLTCPMCHKKYVGQTGRLFHVRFRERYRDYKYANNKSKFAQHIIEEGHTFGPMNDITDILHIASKGRMLDTLERFHRQNLEPKLKTS
jgi:hypothetical protein